MNARGDYRIVQITDSHLLAHPGGALLGIPTLASFRLVVEEVFEHLAPVDALVLTGDLSQDGSRESYDLLRDVIGDYRVPAYCLPGNHDKLAQMREVLYEAPFFCAPVVTHGEWRLVMLDSVVPGHDHGELREEQFQLLDDALSAGANTIVFLHHPPLDVGCAWMDTMRLRNGPRLLEVLRRYDNCRAVAFGHAHQEFAGTDGARRLYCAPSTCFQFMPGTEKFALDPAHPGCRVFDLHGDGRLRTHVHRLPVFPFLANRDAAGY